ncbi:hypothetical protein ANCCAN_18138 [Ancylostoma caninum]|uniref:Thrombospondin type 1 domain protein n=1 Tax=Ancylostoma caninum TaxID=29170 RepID=A0A368FV00_ANCCA|nr:hypothetical protein ANCCAN_18138 [Ancylostoma caninum]
MVRVPILFLFIPRLHCHSNNMFNVTQCWSAWSPCTVTCVPITPEAIEADFARRWRVWLHSRCPNVTPPNQLTEFKKCSASVPPCLELETILQPSPRTIYRLWALVLLMLVSVIPSLYICCKYSSGSMMVRWQGNEKPSLRRSKLDSILMTEHLEKSVPDISPASETASTK